MARGMTARTLTELRRHGFVPHVVEKYNAHSRRFHDAFGCDVLAAWNEDDDHADPEYTGPRILLVQSTSASNLANRVTKVQENEKAHIFERAGRCPYCHFQLAHIEAWGWRKRARSKTTPGDRRLWVPNVRQPLEGL